MASSLRHASPAPGLDGAGRLVLGHLRDEIGLDPRLTTWIEGDDWVVLQAHGYGRWFAEGDVLRDGDSLCTRMVQGYGPCIAHPQPPGAGRSKARAPSPSARA